MIYLEFLGCWWLNYVKLLFLMLEHSMTPQGSHRNCPVDPCREKPVTTISRDLQGPSPGHPGTFASNCALFGSDFAWTSALDLIGVPGWITCWF